MVFATVVGALALASVAEAAISVSRAELSSGRLRVEGTGAVPGNGVTVDDKGVFGVADGAGSFRVEASNFSSPTCVVLVSDGVTSTQATLSGCTPTQAPPPPLPPAPGLLSPESGASVVQPVTLRWSQVTDPAGPIIGYDWEVATSSTFGASIRAWGTTWYPADGAPAPTEARFSGIANGTYFWRVRSIRKGSLGESPVHSNWSSVRSLTVTGSVTGTTAPPTLSKPANDQQYHPWEYFDIEWNAVPGAVRYVLEYDDEPAFDYPLSNIVVDTDGTRANGGYGYEAGWVYWRVRAVNADGVRSLPSAVRRFGVFYAAPVPPPPTLVAPADGAQAALPVKLDWSDQPNPQPGGYQLQIDDDPAFTGGCGTIDLCVHDITPSEYTVGSLTAGRKYWRVLSVHGESAPGVAATAGWSPTRSFTIPAAPPGLSAFELDKLFVHSGDHFQYRIEISPPRALGEPDAVVGLSSDSPAVPVPATVTIPSGQSDVIDRIFTAQAPKVEADTLVTLTATFEGTTRSATITVKPPALAGVDIGAPAVPAVFPAGVSAVGHVLFKGWPADGSVIALQSTNPAAHVPPSITISGSSPASFTITTDKVTTTQTGVIRATWKGVTVEKTITLHPPPTLLSPTNGASAASGSTVILDWNDLDGISYWIQVDDSPQFTAPLFVDQSSSRTSSWQTSTLPVGTLHWRVQTLDAYGNGGDWSEVRTLTITGASAPPATPSLQFPTDSARFAPGQSITFDWSDVNGATSYELQIDDSSTFGAPFVLEKTGIGASQYSTSTLPTKTMWWRVRARNSAGASAWTSARRVEVKS